MTVPSISVVLPAYNEEANVARTVGMAVQVAESLNADYEVIVVDDGSRDRTAEVTQGLASQNPRVRLVQHAVNQGYGAALATGFASATKDLVFMTDSDAQFDISEVRKLLPLIEAGADMAIGYRAPRRDPLMRRLNAFGWNLLIRLLFGYVARDVDCAFKLFRRCILDDVNVESRGATFSAELLVRAKRAGYIIREVPVKHLPRVAGRATGARIGVIIRAFRELIRFQSRLSREPQPRRKGMLYRSECNLQ
ncbi:MAG: glycosyltransferase family 2 protein [Bacteroidetes bacterium]|nr:glycosyltransferase family 2 protein [Bacteroidota bacterium]MCL5025574.1 glycosyltransferase family 2 protein [Chloroflexota bacterium]